MKTEKASGSRPVSGNQQVKMSCRTAPSTVASMRLSMCRSQDFPLSSSRYLRCQWHPPTKSWHLRDLFDLGSLPLKDLQAALAEASNCPNTAADSAAAMREPAAMEGARGLRPVLMTLIVHRQLVDVRNVVLPPSDATATLRCDSSADPFHKTDPPTDLETPRFPMGLSLPGPICSASTPCAVRHCQTEPAARQRPVRSKRHRSGAEDKTCDLAESQKPPAATDS